MKRYGIIGNPLGHSYSEQYFTDLFARESIDAIYAPYTLSEIREVEVLLGALEGFNVTYPYKEAILPYLTGMDAVAEKIGAVNVVHKGKGYNTDWIGFRDSLRPLLTPQDKRALLLGSGGVSKAIQYALQEMGIGYTIVSRKGNTAGMISYEEIDEEVMKAHHIIVNCTPLGMHPFAEDMPNIPYDLLTEEHLLYDCIYNPEKTHFLQMGAKSGCRIKNGLEMLHLQADEAWKIFRG